MIYLQEKDYKAYIQQRFFTESQADEPDAFETIETQVIAEIADRLSGRYNTVKIFDVANPIRNEFLAKIITKIAIYELIRRNPARKVPTDYVHDYQWAQRMIDKLEAGTPKLSNLPPADKNGDGNPDPQNIWGNNTNKHFFS